ncbi:preprotein translocase subunit SecA [Fulvivirga lutimaris]|uniref:preprotein translocase subunit SecA n=1 Tax=Fulvivirga lutimaris TaxID=1819566 RepID=UPI0012BB71D5|nr:preprotein translocase subunit SecA [Fulvivirga lutimaris]MTI38357.1 hypothetical protein [Fulvivirga lutimaris]
MFGLFKSKPPKAKIDYLVYRTEVAKYKMMVDDIRQKFSSTKDVVVVCFFKDTYEQLLKLFEVSQVNKGDHDTKFTLFMYEEGEWKAFDGDYEMILADVHPLASVMQDILGYYSGKSSLTCYMSLDNAFFSLFGGERLISLLDSLGIGEYESISHAMVDKSIDQAQKKIEAKVEFPKPANSIDEWMKLNVKE